MCVMHEKPRQSILRNLEYCTSKERVFSCFSFKELVVSLKVRDVLRGRSVLVFNVEEASCP